MKINSLLIVFLVLSIGLSCRLLAEGEYMFDQDNLRKAFNEFQEKNGTKGNLVEIEISSYEVTFNTGLKTFIYSKGYLSEDRHKPPSSFKNFQLDEVDMSNIDKAMTAAIELSKNNSYLDKRGISSVFISKQTVNRDDNLVSNIDKYRDAMRLDVYVSDGKIKSKYTTNLQGEIVDVAETNVKPRLEFLNAEQMNKSLAEIKPLFGGKLSVADFDIHIENFYFTAPDPKNPDEMNVYRFNSQEFLQASKSPFQKTLEDKKREEEMRRGGTPEETIEMRSTQFILFDIGEIDFSLIPVVMEKLLAATKSSRPKVSGILIRKQKDQFTKVARLEWRVEMVGDRSEKETVIFDGKGNIQNEGK